MSLFSPGGVQELSAAVAASLSILPEPGAPAPAGHSPTRVTVSPSHCSSAAVPVPSLPDSELSGRTGLLISSQGWGGQLHPQMFLMVFFP